MHLINIVLLSLHLLIFVIFHALAHFRALKEVTAYISMMEDDFVILVKKILETKMKVGVQVGIISYNEIPLKQIILDGITTISADFKTMGERAATMILEKSTQHVAVPFYLTLRNSL